MTRTDDDGKEADHQTHSSWQYFAKEIFLLQLGCKIRIPQEPLLLYCNTLLLWYRVTFMNRAWASHADIFQRLLGLPRWINSSLVFISHGMNSFDVLVLYRHPVFWVSLLVNLTKVSHSSKAFPKMTGRAKPIWRCHYMLGNTLRISASQYVTQSGYVLRLFFPWYEAWM